MEQIQMYTIDQTAEILQLSPVTVRRMLYSKAIKGVKVGNQWRIPFTEIERISKEGA